MVRPAISTPYPLPREREAGADDKSPKTNFSRIDWSKERTPVAIIHDDVAPPALREFQLNDALLSQREIQIDEGGALAHPAEPEGYNMTTPIAGLTIYGDEQHWSATLEDDGDHAGNELLPCPICGSTDLELANTHTPSYWVACHNCGAEVPGDLPDGGGSVISSQQDCERLHRTAINSAVARWNTRSTGSKMTKPASFQRVLDELDAIGADTRPDLAPLINAIRAYGNAQYDPLFTAPTPAAQSVGQEAVARIHLFKEKGKWAFAVTDADVARLSLGGNDVYAAPVNGGERETVEVAGALEQRRALAIVKAVRDQHFGTLNPDIPTQASAAFDLACEEIEHRLRTEQWTLEGAPAPLPAADAQQAGGDS
ncbi:hypothetical protein PAP18089_01893 [Pandoraea apista]|uniref:Uncharacterized protein n=1 Tax=Pandoraea apista TaxID=93218 RepID=A0A5E5P2S9_9BURK|nr:Lar family restriction alleviation protein [Pandoraea apista]VVG70921.1 hypothetical protein PAP18089_01893 [Pandoraea apista]